MTEQTKTQLVKKVKELEGTLDTRLGQLKEVITAFEEEKQKCRYCHNQHPGEKCPRIQLTEYYPLSGKMKVIKFFDI